MVLLRAIALVPDPEAKAVGQAMLASTISAGIVEHGDDLVAATLAYAEAHYHRASLASADLDHMVAGIERWADKAALRRRRQVSHMTLPMRDGPPHAPAVSHGSVRDHVGQTDRNSHNLQTL
jgi:hypothetical protein